jgi:hypothetical protein
MVPISLTRLFGCSCLVLVSENEIEFMRASFPGCPCNSGAVADFPTRDSHKSVPPVAEKLDTLLILWGDLPWRQIGKYGHAAVIFMVRFIYISGSHQTFISLPLEKTECKFYEHKWLTSSKLIHKTGSILKIRAAVSLENPVNFYQNTWHRRFILQSHHCENLKFHKTNIPKKEQYSMKYYL